MVILVSQFAKCQSNASAARTSDFAFQNLISIRSRRRAVEIRWSKNQPVPFPRGGKDVNLARFYRHAYRRWPARLRIRQRQRGQRVSSGCEHATVMLVPWNVRGPFPVDRQSNEEIASEIRCALHNHSANFSAVNRSRCRSRLSEKSRERLNLSRRNQDYAR